MKSKFGSHPAERDGKMPWWWYWSRRVGLDVLVVRVADPAGGSGGLSSCELRAGLPKTGQNESIRFRDPFVFRLLPSPSMMAA